ncbi:MAG: dephospho-CoA kinase [Labilithrix sp.]|nr:dephospho-CoA kinase [Labilithrix sp.]MCW5812547.1 dephospho-CoA kinase [Labilithrix sp.]
MLAALREDVWDTRRRMVDDLRLELEQDARAAEDPREVRVVETHLSWVLLGRDAYKIKKPVTLPFVDFASFEARERACHNEVRVNRRLAPRTYHGVIPVRRRRDGRFTLAAGGGPVVEWAVRMKRLDEATRADVLLQDGRLEGPTVDALARMIARFHAGSPTGPRIVRCGEAGFVERHVEENFVALRETASALLAPEGLAEVEAWQLAFVRKSSGVFTERMKAGAIRDGHGDLRLEHVFVRGGDFDVIDAIEFDDRYRWGDVSADVAFLAMDLARLGRVDLAERFVATYAEEAGDYDLYRVLDFYESYRACVRAKIHAAAATSAELTDPVREAAAAEARRCLVLAQAAHRRTALDPVVVVVAGGIASGKTTLAARLAEHLSAPVVEADRTRKQMLGIAATEHATAGAWQGAYDPSFSVKVYAEMNRRAQAVLGSGRPVILDGSFRTAEARALARELAIAHGVPFRLVECRVPADVARARVAARDAATSTSDATPDIVDAFAAAFEPIRELSPGEHIVVDTSGSLDAPLARVLGEIEAWPRGLVA